MSDIERMHSAIQKLRALEAWPVVEALEAILKGMIAEYQSAEVKKAA